MEWYPSLWISTIATWRKGICELTENKMLLKTEFKILILVVCLWTLGAQMLLYERDVCYTRILDKAGMKAPEQCHSMSI